MSKIFIFVSELGPIFIIVPSNFLHNEPYSLSGSIIYCSIPNNAERNIISFVKKDFPEPDIPNILIFEFLYFILLNRSMNTSESLYMFLPINIPFSS